MSPRRDTFSKLTIICGLKLKAVRKRTLSRRSRIGSFIIFQNSIATMLEGWEQDLADEEFFSVE